jgi:hypothetical protein
MGRVRRRTQALDNFPRCDGDEAAARACRSAVQASGQETCCNVTQQSELIVCKHLGRYCTRVDQSAFDPRGDRPGSG